MKLSLGRRETGRADDRPVNYTDAGSELEKRLLLNQKNHHLIYTLTNSKKKHTHFRLKKLAFYLDVT